MEDLQKKFTTNKMGHIKKFSEHTINEAVQSKAIDVEIEQKKQTQYQDQIKTIKDKMAKDEAETDKKQFQKTKEKSQAVASIAKITSMIAASMNKESQALQALSKEQSAT